MYFESWLWVQIILSGICQSDLLNLFISFEILFHTYSFVPHLHEHKPHDNTCTTRRDSLFWTCISIRALTIFFIHWTWSFETYVCEVFLSGGSYTQSRQMHNLASMNLNDNTQNGRIYWLALQLLIQFVHWICMMAVSCYCVSVKSCIHNYGCHALMHCFWWRTNVQVSVWMTHCNNSSSIN